MRDDAGGVTVEAAFASASIVAVLVLCLGAVLSVSHQVRCQDAAREAARLAARGDGTRAVEVAARVAPSGASIEVRTDGDLVVATVTVDGPLLPMVTLTADAVAAVEPEVNGDAVVGDAG
ncbi:TadE family type IV pilus minor pilin [Rhodococcus sp. (in: high G+C Gram-positive bacteria)]|uniref:TadE family type IV pilus minor pilin n=1 Tax=Rhodococcus sp. TaxID=1831 RepID=UPI00257E1D73|nr:TadE family type IV pilus minor pilin [Rhodococcus sp. (in: high G+C Gram-positive bacteria)]